MNPEPLPADLRDLEAQLVRRPGPEAAPELRARILDATVAPSTRPGRGWRVLALAAVVVFVLNIVLSVGNGVRFERLAELTNALPSARPRTSDAPNADDPFQQYAESALASVRPVPGAGAPDRGLFSHEER